MGDNGLRSRVAALMPRAKEELAELVSHRSVADARQFPPEECERAAQWVSDRFGELGFTDLELVPTADGSKAVYGRRPASAKGHNGTRTVLL